ncbi:MAG: hypothetical protein HYW69_02890 [Candidatus Nealsonbacteria bacterium]|nr:hypothetical protein [Candidatus Nealsonbacteria bacterium]
MNTSQNGLWTMTKGEFEESVRKIEVAIIKGGGDPRKLFDRIRTDEIYADKVAEFMLNGGLKGSVTQKEISAKKNPGPPPPPPPGYQPDKIKVV